MSVRAGSVVAGKYRLLERLGAGALGEVWCARNEVIDREVALKLLVPKWTIEKTSLARFFEAAKASGKIRHPSIVELLDLGESQGTPFVAMELLEAEKLEVTLARLESFPVGTALRVVAELSRALVAAHEMKLFHHRIEPANVLLHRDAKGVIVPKLVDFGVARLVADISAANGPHDEDLLGPLGYLSPEQARDEAEVGPESDVWGLGVLLHAMCVGAPPHTAATREGLLHALEGPQRSAYEIDPSVDKKVSDLIGECLVPNRALRPTARVFAERAEDLLRRFDDQWRDFAEAIDIPKERTIRYLASLAPAAARPSSAPEAGPGLEELPSIDGAPKKKDDDDNPVSTLIRRSLTSVDAEGSADVLEDLERQLLERLESKRAPVETAPRASMEDVPPPAEGIFTRDSVRAPSALLTPTDPPEEEVVASVPTLRERPASRPAPPETVRSRALDDRGGRGWIAIAAAFVAVAVFAVWVARTGGASTSGSSSAPANASPSPPASSATSPTAPAASTFAVVPSVVVPASTIASVAPSTAPTTIPSIALSASTKPSGTFAAPAVTPSIKPSADPFYGVTSSGI